MHRPPSDRTPAATATRCGLCLRPGTGGCGVPAHRSSLRETSDEEIFTSFFPSSPENEITGSIISAEGVLTEIGQYQVVVLDRGIADGVKIGNVFAVYQQGKVIRDKVKTSSKAYENTELIDYLGKINRQGEPVILPNVRAGVAMVFRTFDRVSYALVMEATIPIHLHDIIKSL